MAVFLNRTRSRNLFVMLILSLVAGCGAPLPGEVGTVIRVVDGDTIRVSLRGQDVTVRYIGIDAPELSRNGSRAEPYASESEQANRRLVLGQMVRLVADTSDTDRYGRLLRYVYADDKLVNAELVRQGLARARAYPPDTARQAELDGAQSEARAARRGIWSGG